MRIRLRKNDNRYKFDDFNSIKNNKNYNTENIFLLNYQS